MTLWNDRFRVVYSHIISNVTLSIEMSDMLNVQWCSFEHISKITSIEGGYFIIFRQSKKIVFSTRDELCISWRDIWGKRIWDKYLQVPQIYLVISHTYTHMVNTTCWPNHITPKMMFSSNFVVKNSIKSSYLKSSFQFLFQNGIPGRCILKKPRSN